MKVRTYNQSFCLSKYVHKLICFKQEMMDIVKAIYDMMGKYTYPVLKEEAPKQHVDFFFQVSKYFHLLNCI